MTLISADLLLRQSVDRLVDKVKLSVRLYWTVPYIARGSSEKLAISLQSYTVSKPETFPFAC